MTKLIWASQKDNRGQFEIVLCSQLYVQYVTMATVKLYVTNYIIIGHQAPAYTE